MIDNQKIALVATDVNMDCRRWPCLAKTLITDANWEEYVGTIESWRAKVPDFVLRIWLGLELRIEPKACANWRGTPG